MSKVTSKYQVSVPRALADRYGIKPGDDLVWQACGEHLRVVPAGAHARRPGIEERLRAFDETTRRIAKLMARRASGKSGDRGWTRDELYDERVRPR